MDDFFEICESKVPTWRWDQYKTESFHFDRNAPKHELFCEYGFLRFKTNGLKFEKNPIHQNSSGGFRDLRQQWSKIWKNPDDEEEEDLEFPEEIDDGYFGRFLLLSDLGFKTFRMDDMLRNHI